MSEYFIYTTSKNHSDRMGKRIQKAVREIDRSMDWTGPISIPGNNLRGWLSRPNDGTNDYNYQANLNSLAAKKVAEMLGL